jgi:hypothetical protein
LARREEEEKKKEKANKLGDSDAKSQVEAGLVGQETVQLSGRRLLQAPFVTSHLVCRTLLDFISPL